MRRALAILLALVSLGGCASKSAPSPGGPQPSLTQRMIGSLPHPSGDFLARRQAEPRDKDNDF